MAPGGFSCRPRNFMKRVAVLFVSNDSPYLLLPDTDPWGKHRDARLYRGSDPVIAHPPCERWGRYWSGGPSAKRRRKLGDDEGCFEYALGMVQLNGGVLEHPADSKAWDRFGLFRPMRAPGWFRADRHGGYTCYVEQGHYGHMARKGTWLYVVSDFLPALKWGPSKRRGRLEEGFHTNEERARARGVRPIERLSARQRELTPLPFAKLLLSIARSATEK